jgi:hypothetical protein
MFHRYSPVFDVSVFLSPLSKPRAFHIMGFLDGRPALVGGTGQHYNVSLLDVERYHEYFDRWEVLNAPLLTEERIFSAGFGNLDQKTIKNCV